LNELSIETARIFEPLLQPSRYKGAWGGRGSGKSHYMAGAVVEHCLLNPGSRIVCIREVQKTLAQSAKLLIENKIQEFGVGSAFHLRDAEFQVEVIPNQGSRAAAMRIEAVRRIFPRCWFNETTTEAGRDALGFYHEKKDEQRDVGLGPEHDGRAMRQTRSD
jgi:terminase large subunit-like protein